MSRADLRTDIWHHKGVAAFTLIRALAAGSILIFPFWGFAVSIVLDILDGRFLLTFGRLDKLVYDLWDKVLDSITFLAELVVAAGVNGMPLFFWLFFYRMIGHVVFWITKRPSILVFFPNLFESAFLWLLIPPAYYNRWMTPTSFLWLLFALKLGHEIILHWIWPTYWGRGWGRLMKKLFGQQSFLATFLSTSYPSGYDHRSSLFKIFKAKR